MAGADRPLDDATRPGIGALFARLSAEVRALVQAQLALYKLEAKRRAVSGGKAAGFAFVALMLVQAALVVLLGGLVALLVEAVGLGLALTIVVVVTLILAGVLAWLGARQARAVVEPDEVA